MVWNYGFLLPFLTVSELLINVHEKMSCGYCELPWPHICMCQKPLGCEQILFYFFFKMCKLGVSVDKNNQI